MINPLTPPQQLQSFPSTPSVPFHHSSYNDLGLKRKENSKWLYSWLETPCPVILKPSLAPKETPYDILEKQCVCVDRVKTVFLPKNKEKKEKKTCIKCFPNETMFFYDEENPFLLKNRENYKVKKEPIKKSNKPHDPKGFSFLFRGKKIIRPFVDGEGYDLKPKQLFQEMSSLNTALNEMEDEFTPTKRKRRRYSIQTLDIMKKNK